MPINPEFNIQEDSLDQKQQLQRLIFRILPFWPFIFLTLALGIIAGKIYLRYATKIYAVKARVIVNDDSQQKTANLVDIVQLDTRNMSTETEKQMEILGSRNLLSKLVKTLQLNVSYGFKGYIKSGPSYDNVPFKLILANPDSIDTTVKADVEVKNNTIFFNNKYYPVDTFVETKYGELKWQLNSTYLSNSEGQHWYVQLEPVHATVNKLQKALKIEPISKQSSILEITYTDPIPKRGLNILSNLLSLYGSTTVDYKSRMSENTLKFLDERLQLVAGELGGVEKKLQSYKSENDIVDLSTQGKDLLDRLKETDSKISELDVQMDVLNRIQKYLQSKNESSSEIPATLGIPDPGVNDLLNQLYQAQFELQKIKETSGPKNPNIAVLETQINKLKPSLQASIQNLKGGIEASKKQLESNNERLTQVLNQMPLKERELLDISRQQGIKNDIYTFLLQKKEEAAINAAGIVANYRIIDEPETAGLVKPIPLRVYALSILIALILIALIIYFKEFSSTKLKFRSQIENRSKVPVLAEIAYQPHETDSPIVITEGERSLVAEEFRELRTNINYLTFNVEKEGKVILITSSIPGEGKSFVSINTSISLSLTGRKVVLLEFDLRKPKISKELGIRRSLGLSTYLINKSSIAEIIQPHPSISNFNIIASGPIPPNPSELISTPRLKEMFSYLKQHYDYIIIDSPPVGSVTDAKILAGEANASLYIIRQNYTHSSFLELVNSIYDKKLLPNLNIVFNGIKVKKIPGYRYGAEYGYGHGFGYGYSEPEKQKKWWRFWK